MAGVARKCDGTALETLVQVGSLSLRDQSHTLIMGLIPGSSSYKKQIELIQRLGITFHAAFYIEK